MQLEKSQVFGRGSIRRSTQKDGEVLDGADVVALGIGAEVADRHVFDHAPPQRADGRLAHRGAPSRGRGWTPLDPRNGTPAPSPQSVQPIMAAPAERATSRATSPAKRVRSMTLNGLDLGSGLPGETGRSSRVVSQDGRQVRRTYPIVSRRSDLVTGQI